MSAVEHDHGQLGAYVLGALEPGEAAGFEAHLRACADCRREVEGLREPHARLGEVPPEAFLDGPPEGADLLLRRTLYAVRAAASEAGSGVDAVGAAETDAAPRIRHREPAPSRRMWTVVAAAAAVLVALGAGVLVGRRTVSPAAAPPLPPATSQPPAGGRTLTGADPVTGAKVSVLVIPAAGWVRLHTTVQGIADGEHCVLQVTPKLGAPVIGATWVVSVKAEATGAGFDGSAYVPADDIASVDVVDDDGRTLVSARA